MASYSRRNLTGAGLGHGCRSQSEPCTESRDGRRSVSAETAGTANGYACDDLCRISGLGQDIARRLDEAGIRTYAELADCSFGEIAKALPGAGPLLWRCIDGWRHRAQELRGGTVTALERGGPAAGNGQHYESFIVRVLLNNDGSIRDTRMEHIGTGEVKRWAGWEHDAMLGFIKEAAAPTAPPVLLAAPVGPLDAEPHPESVPDSVAEPSATSQVRPISQPPVTAKAPTTPLPLAQPEASQATAGSAAADASPPGLLAPIVRLRPDRTVLRTAQPFAVTLSLDLTKLAPQSGRLMYSAVIVARQLGGRSGGTLASPRGLVRAADTITITIDAAGLPPGIYLLEAAVSLRAEGASRAGAAAMAEGIMLRVLPS
jgi:predicted flap endonuclease-1-like 5' DNA nuclease